MERLLIPADAARILGVVPAMVRLMAISGRLPPSATTESGMRLFSRADVERLAREWAACRSPTSGYSWRPAPTPGPRSPRPRPTIGSTT